VRGYWIEVYNITNWNEKMVLDRSYRGSVINLMKGTHSIGIRREPEEVEDEANLGKGTFWRMQENAEKYEEGLRDELETRSDGDMLHKALCS
jgi:uncharacterized protein (DUF169 family)